MTEKTLDKLREEIETVNRDLLRLLSRRGALVTEVQRVKTRAGIPTFDPEREQRMLLDLAKQNTGPFSDETICRLFKELFRASLDLMESSQHQALRVSRNERKSDLHIQLRDFVIGDDPVLVAGPCSVESEKQMDEVGRMLASCGVRLMRGGAFKPRSSPYAFQGLGEEGLKIMQTVAERYDLHVVTEVMDTRQVETVSRYADVLQVGARNMQNFELLREVGRCGKPVLLKRGLCATLDELLWSAEYIITSGNDQVILCERGIRTFERETRNTLDISAVPLLRQKTYLPVIVDVSHSAGRRDILGALGRAALAAGANGLMVEVHPTPVLARSDSHQQLDFADFVRFMTETGFARPLGTHASVTVARGGTR